MKTRAQQLGIFLAISAVAFLGAGCMVNDNIDSSLPQVNKNQASESSRSVESLRLDALEDGTKQVKQEILQEQEELAAENEEKKEEARPEAAQAEAEEDVGQEDSWVDVAVEQPASESAADSAEESEVVEEAAAEPEAEEETEGSSQKTTVERSNKDIKEDEVDDGKEKEQAQGNFTAGLQVVAPDGLSTYAVDINTGATVEQLMKNAQQHGFTYATKGFGKMGLYVTAVNGREEDDAAGMYWIYYVNGQRATMGITAQTLSKGDIIKWNYEKGF
ncbi:DUF4430 domain-containing protein [Patescibacteria group bacterium]